MVSRSKYFGLLLCMAVTFIFSLHYMVAKIVLDAGVSPFALSAWRGLVGGGLLLFLFRQQISTTVLKHNAFSILFIAFLGFFINQLLFMKGLSLTTPLNASLVSNTIPIVSAVVAFAIGLERMTLKKLTGIVLTFSLVTYLLLSKQETSTSHGLNTGDFLIFLNVLAFCLAFVLGKKLLKQNFPYELLTGSMLFIGGLMMSTLAGQEMTQLYHYATENSVHLFHIIFEILISTSVVYLLNIKALQLMTVTKVSFFIYLQPIITGVSHFFMNGEAPPLKLYLVFLGILIGGYLVVLDKGDT